MNKRDPQSSKRSNGWIRSGFWKYLGKGETVRDDDTLRGERSSSMAFRSLNADSSLQADLLVQASSKGSTSPKPLVDDFAKECSMKRVDPDSVDFYFADYSADHWTGTLDRTNDRAEGDRMEGMFESELLSGVEAIIDFIQATQENTTSTTSVVSTSESRTKSKSKAKR